MASMLQAEPPSVIKDWWQGEHRSIPFRISLTDTKGKELNVSAGTLSIRKGSFDISVRKVNGETFASYSNGKLWLGTPGIERFAVTSALTRDEALKQSLGMLLEQSFPEAIGILSSGLSDRITDLKVGLRTIHSDRHFKGSSYNYYYSDRTGEPILIIKKLNGPRASTPAILEAYTWRCQFGSIGKPAS